MNPVPYKILSEKDAAMLMMLWGALHDIAEHAQSPAFSDETKVEKRLGELDEQFEEIISPKQIEAA